MGEAIRDDARGTRVEAAHAGEGTTADSAADNVWQAVQAGTHATGPARRAGEDRKIDRKVKAQIDTGIGTGYGSPESEYDLGIVQPCNTM